MTLDQSTLMMLDMPLDKDPVTAEDLANFSVRAFGAEALLKSKSTPVRPVFPPDSLFLRQFKHLVGRTDEAAVVRYKQHHPSTHGKKRGSKDHMK